MFWWLVSGQCWCCFPSALQISFDGERKSLLQIRRRLVEIFQDLESVHPADDSRVSTDPPMTRRLYKQSLPCKLSSSSTSLLPTYILLSKKSAVPLLLLLLSILSWRWQPRASSMSTSTGMWWRRLLHGSLDSHGRAHPPTQGTVAGLEKNSIFLVE